MKLAHFLTIANEVKDAKFDFHGEIGVLDAFNSQKEFYWRIAIEQKFNSEENYTYAKISFGLRVLDTELNLTPKEIACNSVERYFEFAKMEFLRQISEYRITGISQF
jgi:hypothetical protein